MATNQGSLSLGTAQPTVISGTVTPRQPSTGAVSAAGAAPTVAVAATQVLTFPRLMLCGVGGDQGYGRTNGYPWTTAAAGTLANTAIQKIAAYDIAVINGSFEGWDSNGTYDRENLTQACLKKQTTYSVKLSQTRPCTVFYYQMMMSTAPTGGPSQQYANLVQANNWWLYESTGGTGTITPAGGGQNTVNYSVAWPSAIGSAGIGASICGSNYGTTSSGSPTGPQGPARTMGNYASLKLLIRNNTGVDSRFSFNPQMASPSCGGIFLDNCFAALDGQGNIPNSSLDGLTLAPGGQVGSWPTFDTVQPVMARGNRNMFDQLQTMTATYQSGSTFYNFANFGQYANVYQFRKSDLVNAGLDNLQGGLLENATGAGLSSWECFQQGDPNTGNTSYPSGWPNLLANYYAGMDFCLAPKLVGVGCRLPAVDGSTTASWPVGAGTTLTTVTSGSALEYQLMRYTLCTTLLDDGYFAPGVGSPNNYDWSLPRWYDEYGDDSLGQVNVKRGYLGVPLTVRPSSATWAQGTMGVWSRSFSNGIAIVNPRGNGAQTVTLNGNYLKLSGTQQPTINNGASVTTVSLADGDGIILLGPTGNTDYTWSATVTGSAKSAAAGYIAPVIFCNGSNASRANYQGGMIFPVTSAGTVDMYFERVLGETGAISITVSTFASTNATAGTHYTALNNVTVSFADGEIGWKKVSIPILAMPTGFGLAGISMAGANAYRPNAWIFLQGSGRVPGATYFQSSNGVNIVPGSTGGAGTQASPYTSLQNAATHALAGNRIVYWIQNGTNGHQEWAAGTLNGGTSNFPNSYGVNFNAFNASLAAPLIILPDPGNTSPAFFDQGSSGGATAVVYSNAFGINFQGNSANVWICGIHFHRCNIVWNPGLNAGAAGNGTNNVVWQCEIDNYSQNGSNAAGIRFDQNTNIIIQDCYVHEIYSDESNRKTNPFTTVPSGFEEGCQAFASIGSSISQSYASKVQFGFMEKQGLASGTEAFGFDVKHCVGDFFAQISGGDGAFTHFSVQGGQVNNTTVRYCASDATGCPVQVAQFAGNEQGPLHVGVDIFNCVQIANAGVLGGWYGATGLRLFNTISQGATGAEMLLGIGTVLAYSDFNTYVGSSHSWETHYGAGTVTYSTLASWQTAADSYLASAPDVHSTVTTTTPSYTNRTARDFRINNSGGRGNRPIGVGNERVGIVNNFLASNLPVAP